MGARDPQVGAPSLPSFLSGPLHSPILSYNPLCSLPFLSMVNRRLVFHGLLHGAQSQEDHLSL